MTSYQLPTAEEIAELPLWAEVLFAVRCARRVQPILLAHDLPPKDARAVERAIVAASDVVTEMTSSLKRSDKLLAAAQVAARNAAATIASDPSGGRAAAACSAARAAARAADRAADGAGGFYAHEAAVHDASLNAAAAADAAARAADYDADARKRLRQDFESVTELAKRCEPPFNLPADWLLLTPIAQSSTSLPTSVPESVAGASATESMPAPRAVALELTLTFANDATPEEIASTAAELTRVLDRVYRAHGGSGLVLDTLHVDAPRVAEVPR